MFGDRFDAVRLEELRQQWASGNFEDLTLFEVRSDAELGGANAAYAGENNTVYFSEGFLEAQAGSHEIVASVLLEELGHFVDWEINEVDTPGDEGEFFAATVLDESLDASTLDLLKQEDDSTVLNLDNSNVFVEQSITTGTYSDGIDFGRYAFQGETADYIEKFLGIQVNNSYEYDSGDSLVLRTGYPGFEKTLFNEGGLKAGLNLEGGSFGAGFEAYAGFNLGEIDFDLPLQALLNASDSDQKLLFDFTTIFDAKLDYTVPSAYAVLDAVFDYDIGSLNAFASIAGIGVEEPIIDGLSGEFRHRMVNINTLNDPKVEVNLIPGQVDFLTSSIEVNQDDPISLLGGLATLQVSPLPDFNFSLKDTSTEDQFSVKVSNQSPKDDPGPPEDPNHPDPEHLAPGEGNPIHLVPMSWFA